MKTIKEIIEGLQNVGNRSMKTIVQDKAAKALADVKRARTLLEKAEVTLSWCEREERDGKNARCPGGPCEGGAK